MEDEFLQDENAPVGQNPMEQGQAMPVPPQGMPHLDSTGTTPAGDPYQMVAPGGVEPEDDLPDDVIQAYQEDLVGRAMLAMSDNRKQMNIASPADAFLARINIRGQSAPEAVGGAVGTLMIGLTQNAKRQGVEYPGESLIGAGIEVTQLAIDLAREAGIFPDLPTEDDEEAYEEATAATVLEATKAFGEYMIATGQVDQGQYNEILMQQMEDEAALGELDDWDPMEMMSPDAMRNLINRGVGLAQSKAQPAEEEPPMES